MSNRGLYVLLAVNVLPFVVYGLSAILLLQLAPLLYLLWP